MNATRRRTHRLLAQGDLARVALFLLLTLLAPLAHANFSSGGFAAPSRTASSWTAGVDATGAWFSSGFNTTTAAAELTVAGPGNFDDRVLMQAIPMPAATTYAMEVRARFSSASQKFYWHVLAVTKGTKLNLNAGGVPSVISQSGVKSLYRGVPPAAAANGAWAGYTASFTVSAADAAAYQYIVIALVASRTTTQVAQFDDVYTDAPALTVDPQAGLTAEWYNVAKGLSSLAQINWDNPTLTTKVEQLNWVNTTNAPFTPNFVRDYFGVRVTGSITIPTTGTWTFTLGSDDGSSLSINKVAVLTQNNLQSFTSRSVKLSLAAGTYPFEARFFENGGQQGFRLSWQGPGMAAAEYVPPSAFSKKGIRILRWSESSPIN
jgi:hypothetical protein